MKQYKIPLVRNTISLKDLSALSKWLLKNPHITKGPLCQQFEEKFAKWQNSKYAHFVNSGSSANLLAINALLISGDLKPGDKVIAPAVSWTTTITPISQLNLKPALCDCDLDTLGLDLNHFERLAKQKRTKAVIICHVLGIPNQLKQIVDICKKYNLILIEDCCEALGSKYNHKKVGNFGLLSTFSFYFGHHMSTIEGGMVCTNSNKYSNIIRSLRSHGWNRDLDNAYKLKLRRKHSIDKFADKYTFYYPGFNFRSADLNAFLGLRQLKSININVKKRNQVFNQYLRFTQNVPWQPKPTMQSFVSGFAFPFFSKDRLRLAKQLEKNNIETRPLICGSIGRQPWFVKLYGLQKLKNADMVHQKGLYVPINPEMTTKEVKIVSNVLCKYQ